MEGRTKKCTYCGESKSLTDFFAMKQGQYGRRAKCKICYKKVYGHIYKKRIKLQKSLPHTLTHQEIEILYQEAENTCMVTGEYENVNLDHFVPLLLGKVPLEYGLGGTTYENTLLLVDYLNKSKNSSNPFEWIEKAAEKFDIDMDKWNNAVEYMAKKNRMTTIQYINRVNECFNHYRILKWIEELNLSLSPEGSGRPKSLLARALSRGMVIETIIVKHGSATAQVFLAEQREFLGMLKTEVK